MASSPRLMISISSSIIRKRSKDRYIEEMRRE
jgi:hypothetical protein